MTHADRAEILVSADAGQTWEPLGGGQEQLPRVWDLALGIDGATLYAALPGGIGRLPVQAP